MFLPLKAFVQRTALSVKDIFDDVRHDVISTWRCCSVEINLDKFSNVLVHWSIRMIRAKNYETVSKLSKLWLKYSGLFIFRTRCILYTGYWSLAGLILAESVGSSSSSSSFICPQYMTMRPKKLLCFLLQAGKKYGRGAEFFSFFSFLWQDILCGTRCPRMWILAR